MADALLQAAQKAADGAPGDGYVELLLADAHSKRAAVLRARGVWDDAALDYTRAAAIHQMLADLDPGAAGRQRLLAFALAGQRACLAASGRPDDAVAAATRCVAAGRRAVELEPEHRDHADSLAEALNALARLAAFEQGDADTAAGCLEESIGIFGRLAEQAPDHASGLTDLADALRLLGGVLVKHGRHEAAVGPLRRAAATYTDVLARLLPEDHETRKSLAATQDLLGTALLAAGPPQEALARSTNRSPPGAPSPTARPTIESPSKDSRWRWPSWPQCMRRTGGGKRRPTASADR
jgi:tetratricopeptide (TPR) repeat protein